MDKFKKLNVEGREYRLLPMAPAYGAIFAARVAVLLTSILGAEADGLSQIISSFKSGSADDEGVQAQLFRLVMKLLPHLNPKEFAALCDEALKTDCFAGGNRLNDESHFNSWFDENRGDYFPVAIWAIRMHCQDFFVKGGPAFRALAGLPTL